MEFVQEPRQRLTVTEFDTWIIQPVQILNESDTLEGGALLPGFSLAIEAIFR